MIETNIDLKVENIEANKEISLLFDKYLVSQVPRWTKI